MRAAMLLVAVLVSRSLSQTSVPPPEPACPFWAHTPRFCSWITERIKNHNRNFNWSRRLPQCDSRGNFEQQQCRAPSGPCWCVHPFTGIPIPGTWSSAGPDSVQCGQKKCPGSNFDDIHYLPFMKATCDQPPICSFSVRGQCQYTYIC